MLGSCTITKKSRFHNIQKQLKLKQEELDTSDVIVEKV